MKAPRLRIVLPTALLICVATPLIRSLPGGDFYPDLLLLLLLVATPVKIDRLRTALLLVFVFGLLRGAVSAVPVFTTWAGMGLGLALRAFAHHHVSDHRFLGRLLVGVIAALPLALFDAQAGQQFGFHFANGVLEWRVAWLAIAWAIFQTPPTWRGRMATS